MLIAHTANKLHSELDARRFKAGTRRCVSLVTTHGNLHDGHGAVINAAKTVSDLVVVAIIPHSPTHSEKLVTATEFQDIGFAERHDADILFSPQEEFLVSPHLKLTQTACDEAFRLPEGRLENHLRIINAVQPDIMVWGERNYIEYAQVRSMIAELGVRTQVQCIPTVRHADGWAVSGLERQFSEQDRARLPLLYETLRDAAHAIRSGARAYAKVEKTARIALKGGGFSVLYFRILDDDTLLPAEASTTSFRIVTRATINDITVEDSLGLSL